MKQAIKCIAGFLFISSALATESVSAGDLTPKSETYSFKVSGKVSYRCYGGYGPKKGVDSRTKVPCDNETKKETLFNQIVVVQIKTEPNPDDSKDLYGSWDKSVEFEGRKFTAFLSLSKTVDVESKTPYRLSVDARDDEPMHRQTTTFSEATRVKDLNALTVNYNSSDQPEEIEYAFSVEAVH